MDDVTRSTAFVDARARRGRKADGGGCRRHGGWFGHRIGPRPSARWRRRGCWTMLPLCSSTEADPRRWGALLAIPCCFSRAASSMKRCGCSAGSDLRLRAAHDDRYLCLMIVLNLSRLQGRQYSAGPLGQEAASGWIAARRSGTHRRKGTYMHWPSRSVSPVDGRAGEKALERAEVRRR
jgi:hypothetical protein